MGTHAVLGVKFPDKTIDACYVHFDGDSMRGRIENFLSEKTTTCLSMAIVEAQAKGGMRSFYCPDYDTSIPTTEFSDGNESYVIDETNFYDDHFGAHYWYLVDYNTGKIEKRSN